ncbi:hypothetical protein ACUWC3_28160, partial [Klebsiella pneumoniae]|uniref:hypothetical protein n=1 Tax=Klebsiella pneumoniae TaxID=573 RepID=UPI0040559897
DNSQIERIQKRATKAIWTCKRMVGSKWGLKPKIVYWMYTAIIRPIITYGSLVWWEKTLQITANKKLEKIQRLICLSITGAIKTCPTAGMEAVLDITPLPIFIKKEALQSALRIQQGRGVWVENTEGHMSILKKIKDYDLYITQNDQLIKRLDFGKRYRVIIPVISHLTS